MKTGRRRLRIRLIRWSLWIFGGLFILFLLADFVGGQTGSRDDSHRDRCRRNLLLVYRRIQEYLQKEGRLPLDDDGGLTLAPLLNSDALVEGQVRCFDWGWIPQGGGISHKMLSKISDEELALIPDKDGGKYLLGGPLSADQKALLTIQATPGIESARLGNDKKPPIKTFVLICHDPNYWHKPESLLPSLTRHNLTMLLLSDGIVIYARVNKAQYARWVKEEFQAGRRELPSFIRDTYEVSHRERYIDDP